MKHTRRIYLVLCAALLGVALIAGCNSKSAKSSLPVKEIVITGNDQMKFDLTTLEAKAGQEVKLTFKNVGTMPKESMGHDWVLLEKNTDPLKFLEPGFAYASNDYIAPEMKKKVIAKTRMLGPGEEETITFTAPSIPSPYDYICTFPGHFAAGMKGVLVVQ